MQSVKMILIGVMVLVAGAATVALAYALSSIGAPAWQAGMGPLLLVAIVAYRWYESKAVAAAKDAARDD